MVRRVGWAGRGVLPGSVDDEAPHWWSAMPWERVFPACAVPPIILNRRFKRVACRGHQALPRRSAHRPARGLATTLAQHWSKECL